MSEGEEGMSGIRDALIALGNNNADTPLGAIEALGERIHSGAGLVADALCDVAAAIRDLAGRDA